MLDKLFYFIISFAKTNKQTNRQTNKQKESWQGHRNGCGQLQRARMLKKNNKKTRNIKKHSDTRSKAPRSELNDDELNRNRAWVLSATALEFRD